FTSSVSGLAATFDASGSSASGGASITKYDWDFGDSSTHGSDAKPSHTYAKAGTYRVKLTVTDSTGATDSVTHDVTVSAPTEDTVAADKFGRTVANGWGVADTGGVWSLSGPHSAFAV